MPEERKQGIFALQTCSVVLADLTAVASIRMIGIESLLEAKHFRFQMSEDIYTLV
jgi:hypothetical protein